MHRLARAHFPSLAALLLACGAAPPAPAPAPSTPPPAKTVAPVAPPAPLFDPVPLGLTADGAKKLCDEHLAKAKADVDAIKALVAKKPVDANAFTFDAVLAKIDDALLEVDDAGDFLSVMGLAHPSVAVRGAAKLCESKTERFLGAMYLDVDVAAAVRAEHIRGEQLTPERARFLEETLRQLKRHGAELPQDAQARLRDVDERLLKAAQEFMANIAEDNGHIDVKPASLEGLPPEYIARHPVKNGKVEITTTSADAIPFLTYAKDRAAAEDLFVLTSNKGGEENLRQLAKIVRLRSEKAKLLGYASWAAFALEPRMAKTPEAVKDFLAKARAAVKDAAKAELLELAKEQGRSSDKVSAADRLYLMDRVARAKFKLDAREVARYFEVNATVKGALDVASRIYGVKIQQVDAPAWHADVRAYDVSDQGVAIGRFYLDLFEREGKFKFAATFPVRTRKALEGGALQTPMAVLLASFPRPEGKAPALLDHADVVTLFHELHHVLHHVFGRPELAAHAPFEAPKDFLEAPSLAFEECAWSKEVLDGFARHVETGAKMPDDLFQAMLAARKFGRALDAQHQLFLASLDLEMWSREPGFDVAKLAQDLETSLDAFVPVSKAHLVSSFGHLITYDAAYYGYMWSSAIARAFVKRIEKKGLLDGPTMAAFRDEVLAPGASEDANDLVTKFLGAKVDDGPYFDFISEKE